MGLQIGNIQIRSEPRRGDDEQIVEKDVWSRVFKKELKMGIVHGWHSGQAILTLQNDDGPQWTGEPICVWRPYRCDSCNTMTAEAITLSKVSNTTTAILRYDKSFIDLQTSMASYAHTFGAEYHVCLWEPRINNIGDDKISSNFSLSYSRSTYVLYIRVRRLVFKQSAGLPLLRELSKKKR